MKIASFFADTTRIGVVEDSEIWDLEKVYARYLFETERTPDCRAIAARQVPSDMALFIRLNHARLDPFRDAVAYIASRRKELSQLDDMVYPLHSIRFLPPVPLPSKVICCGSAYGEYLREIGRTPADPTWPTDVKISFLKQPSALLGHRETIHYPGDSEVWDFENELAIIIGRPCSDISEKDARSCIFGFSVFNDSCVRDLPSWTGGLDSPRGKACDNLAPCGPWIIPSEDLGRDPNDLNFTTWVDGEVRQKSNTSKLLWPIERMVAIAARYIHLRPGDIISTGSTRGNGHSTGVYLKLGQKVICEIEGVGTLENTVGRKVFKGDLPPMPPAQ